LKGRGASPSLEKNITQIPIFVKMLKKLGIYFVVIGIAKLAIGFIMERGRGNAKR
jgi:hypothetical protein